MYLTIYENGKWYCNIAIRTTEEAKLIIDSLLQVGHLNITWRVYHNDLQTEI